MATIGGPDLALQDRGLLHLKNVRTARRLTRRGSTGPINYGPVRQLPQKRAARRNQILGRTQ
jgi:hypothetical protein